MRVEQIIAKRGYVVTEEGVALNPKGFKVGYINRSGYIEIKVRAGKKSISTPAHRLQAFQKYGEKLFIDGTVTRHLNGNPLDNSWENIVIGSQSENMMDIPEQIRIKKAKHAASFVKKYNDQEIIDFHKLCKSYKQTMNKFGISSKGTLNYILNKRSQLVE